MDVVPSAPSVEMREKTFLVSGGGHCYRPAETGLKMDEEWISISKWYRGMHPL